MIVPRGCHRRPSAFNQGGTASSQRLRPLRETPRTSAPSRGRVPLPYAALMRSVLVRRRTSTPAAIVTVGVLALTDEPPVTGMRGAWLTVSLRESGRADASFVVHVDEGKGRIHTETEMPGCFLLRYQQPVAETDLNTGVPSGTATMTKAQLEGRDNDCAVGLAGSTSSGTGTFTSSGREAPDRDYLSAGTDFVFPN